MTRRFYELYDDIMARGVCTIGDIRATSDIRPWNETPAGYGLVDGRVSDAESLIAEVTHPGKMLDFFRTSFAVPIASAHLANAIAAVAGPDVQCLPVRIGEQWGYQVLNALRVIKCIDEERSEFFKWTEQDHRPDRAGQYRWVPRLLLDPALIPNDAHFFRIEGWLVALIVSETVKKTMEAVGCLGAEFRLVTPRITD